MEPDLFSADHLIEALPQWRVALHLVKEELLDEDAQVNLASKVGERSEDGLKWTMMRTDRERGI